jgi:phosphate-selective porin OprO/OprP
MSRLTYVVLGILLASGVPILADEEPGGWTYDGGIKYRSPDQRFQLNITNLVQVRFTAVDPDSGDSGQSFDVNRYRFSLDGRLFKYWEFRLETDFATGSEAEPQADSELLLDAYFEFTRKRMAQLWLGQGLVGFSRQELIYDYGNGQFVERSVATARFAHGRDVGIALYGNNEQETYSYSVGIYNGNGINRDVNENQNHLVVARLIVTPLGAYELSEADPEWTRHPEPKLAIGVSAMTNNMGQIEDERINTGGLQFAFRVRGFTISAEFFTESERTLSDPPGVETDTDGWYAQVGYLFPATELGMFEVAARYSEVLLDVANEDETEIAAVVGYYVRGHRNKLQLEYRDLEFEAETLGIQVAPRIDTQEIRLQIQFVF